DLIHREGNEIVIESEKSYTREEKDQLIRRLFLCANSSDRSKLKKFLREIPDTVTERMKWIGSPKARSFVKKCEYTRSGLNSFRITNIDYIDVEEFLGIIAAKSKNRSEFEQIIDNYDRDHSTGAIILRDEYREKIYQNRRDQESYMNGALNTDKRQL